VGVGLVVQPTRPRAGTRTVCLVWGVGLLFEIWIVDASILRCTCLLRFVPGWGKVCFFLFFCAHLSRDCVGGVCGSFVACCVHRLPVPSAVSPRLWGCGPLFVGGLCVVVGVGGVCDKL
jgi:hypothetical protein